MCARTYAKGEITKTLWVQNFPLPDTYRPDHIDRVSVVNYPVDPPKGDNLSKLLRHFWRELEV